MVKRFFVGVVLLLSVGVASAEQLLSDSAFISLLTCSPGTETYSKYGHTAIRICDPEKHIDQVFNYGLFSFNTEHFYLKFMRGETYYRLGYDYTNDFIESSKFIGRTTYEQRLNLTAEQRDALLLALLKNYEPQNRYYLYNFVFDNCATRPYHLLRKVVDLQYDPSSATDVTFRDAVRHYSEKNSWAGFGIDLIFGRDADQKMTLEQSLFLPENLMNLTDTVLLQSGDRLCTRSNVQPFQVASHPWVGSPNSVVLLVCFFILLITLLDIRRNKLSVWFDASLCLLGALVGLVCFYLSFCSIHPLVEHNYNLLLITPLLLIPFVLYLFPRGRRWMVQRGSLGLGVYFLLMVVVRMFTAQAWHPLLWIPFLHGLRLVALYASTFAKQNAVILK